MLYPASPSHENTAPPASSSHLKHTNHKLFPCCYRGDTRSHNVLTVLRPQVSDRHPALNSCRGDVVFGAVGACRVPVGWCVRGDLCQPVLLAMGAAAGAELAGGAGRVAAGQEAADADAPKEPAGGPAAPAERHGAGHHAQDGVERQQGQGGRRF